MTLQRSLQESTFIGKVLIQGSNRYSCSLRYSCRGQPFLSHAKQNLNSRFENRVYAGD
jgi:hypothetical protein